MSGAAETPKKYSGIDDSLALDFSAMKLHKQSFKRQHSRDTIEGSPMNTKRVDMQKTPLFVKALQDNSNRMEEDGIPTFISMNDLPPFNSPQPTKRPTTPTATTTKKLLVIAAASDGHDTGEHQENALRTALLCGKLRAWNKNSLFSLFFSRQSLNLIL